LLAEHPPWLRGTALHPHQLAALNWLRAAWAAGRPAVIADEIGLGKTASVIAFLTSLVEEFKATAPILVVVPLSMLSFWEGELAFWAPPDFNAVTYSGLVAARNCIHDHELWLQPSSMDGKVGFSGKCQLGGRVPKPDLVVTTYEVLCSDVHMLKAMHWAAVVVDQRQRSRSAAGKAQVGGLGWGVAGLSRVLWANVGVVW
jgi:SNF2 family DNA or RNA helicase